MQRGGQGPQEPGRGVYLARRIVALLIIVLLLVLLLPRACQALLGPQEEEEASPPPPGAPEETSITGEETTSAITEETVEQGSTAVGPSEEEIEAEASSREQSSNEMPLGVETAADLSGMVTGFEPLPAEGEVVSATNQITPIPEAGSQQQQVIQSLAFEQPPLPLAEQPIPLEEPVFFEEPMFFEEPLFSEQPMFFEEEPLLSEQMTPFEEPTVISEGPVASVGAPAPTRSGPTAVINSH